MERHDFTSFERDPLHGCEHFLVLDENNNLTVNVDD